MDDENSSEAATSEYRSPRDTFEVRAPAVDVDELRDLFVSEVLTEELLERASSIWIIGSFANPSKSLDDNAYEWSDLDVFVVVDEWEYPQAATNMLLYAPDESVPRDVPEEVEDTDWIDTESLAGPGKWDCSIDEAWDKIPDYAKQSLRNASKKGFFRNEREQSEGKVRYYDLFVGNEAQLDGQRHRRQAPDMDSLPGFQLYP